MKTRKENPRGYWTFGSDGKLREREKDIIVLYQGNEPKGKGSNRNEKIIRVKVIITRNRNICILMLMIQILALAEKDNSYNLKMVSR